MSHFDIHRNTGKHRDSIPYVVVVQSGLFDDYKRRVVVPLVKASVEADRIIGAMDQLLTRV